MYQISFVPSAAKTIRKLDKAAARRILEVIEELADDPRPRGAIQLKGGNGEYRVRVTDYRIIYDIEDNHLVILVLKIGHRREVYR